MVNRQSCRSSTSQEVHHAHTEFDHRATTPRGVQEDQLVGQERANALVDRDPVRSVVQWLRVLVGDNWWNQSNPKGAHGTRTGDQNGSLYDRRPTHQWGVDKPLPLLR